MTASGPKCKIGQNATEPNLNSLEYPENSNINLKTWFRQNFIFNDCLNVLPILRENTILHVYTSCETHDKCSEPRFNQF